MEALDLFELIQKTYPSKVCDSPSGRIIYDVDFTKFQDNILKGHFDWGSYNFEGITFIKCTIGYLNQRTLPSNRLSNCTFFQCLLYNWCLPAGTVFENVLMKDCATCGVVMKNIQLINSKAINCKQTIYAPDDED